MPRWRGRADGTNYRLRRQSAERRPSQLATANPPSPAVSARSAPADGGVTIVGTIKIVPLRPRSSVPHRNEFCGPAGLSLAGRIKVLPGALVRLVDQPHGSRPVVHAYRWRRAPAPVVERIAHCDEIRCDDVGAREGLVSLCGGELQDPVLHCEDGVVACDLPLTVSADTRKAITDLDGAENAASPDETCRRRSPRPDVRVRARLS